MHVSSQLSRRARAGLAVAVAATTLSLAPAITTGATAAPVRSASTSTAVECTSARTALAQAQKQQRVAKTSLTNARKALARAKKTHKAAKIRKARTVANRALARYRAATRTVNARHDRVAYACVAPTATSRAVATGKALGILAFADGLSVGPISATQLTALLDRLLPGVSGTLTASQFNALLAGFNAAGGGNVNPADLAALLGSAFSPAQVTQLLSGVANPELLAGLARHVLGQLGSLGGLPVPPSFDPTALLDTLAGMFGNLDPAQLGDLLALLTSLSGGTSSLNLGQMTDLIDALVPGISGAFDPAQLTSMLGALNGGALDPASLSNLLGGQFSSAQIASALAGTASQELVGRILAQVLAQLGTAGAGDLVLPTDLMPSQLTGLVDTVTGLLGTLLGGGGELPGLCGLIPLPLLCG